MKKRNYSEQRTWTFQPTPENKKAVIEKIGEAPARGELSKLVNEAITGYLYEAVDNILEQEYLRTKEALKRLKKPNSTIQAAKKKTVAIVKGQALAPKPPTHS